MQSVHSVYGLRERWHLGTDMAGKIGMDMSAKTLTVLGVLELTPTYRLMGVVGVPEGKLKSKLIRVQFVVTE